MLIEVSHMSENVFHRQTAFAGKKISAFSKAEGMFTVDINVKSNPSFSVKNLLFCFLLILNLQHESCW